MKGFMLVGMLLVAGCSQATFAGDAKNINRNLAGMEELCNSSGGAYQIQQYTIPEGTTLFQFVCTNVKQPKPQPPVDTNKVEAP